MKKRGMELSFGMIFSIILIIVFIVFAGYAIKKVVGFQQNAQTGLFLENLQSDINELWGSEQGSFSKEYSLSKKIEKVCLDDGTKNIFFKPSGTGGEFDYMELEHVETFNGDCFNNLNGKIKIRFEKVDETLVTIKAEE
jgi:hypothetical protein